MRPPVGPATRSGWRAQAGQTTAAYTVAIAVSLVAFALLANLTVALYARGVVRAALDQAVRTAARVDAGPSHCEAHIGRILDELVAGPIGEGITWSCGQTAEEVVASAQVRLPGWLVADWTFELHAVAVRELAV